MNEQFQLLKASFRHNPKGWMETYPESIVILLISPGQPYYQGEKLAAIIEAINRYGFKECHIMMGDVNYRHTLRIMSRESEEALYKIAKEIGLQWLEENEHIYRDLAMNYKIFPWEYWLEHPRYLFYRQQLDNLYKHNQQFKESFLSSAQEFLSRQVYDDTLRENKQYAIDCCLEYLKEECTIIMPLWAEMRYRIIIYPNKMLAAMKATYTEFVLPNNNCDWLSLRFEKKKVGNLLELPEEEVE
ncbi:MAG: tRNA-dependent cyclodipeptide synthase [Gammaproteobacteria bacterium]